MAIVNSLAIGRSVKSAGNLTYKVVRGRTIASQKITSNKSNTYLQQERRMKFGNSATAMRLIKTYIGLAYEKSKFGSPRNNFLKINKNFTLNDVAGEVQEGIINLQVSILNCIAKDPDVGKTLNYAAYGTATAIATEERTSYDNYTFADSEGLDKTVDYAITLLDRLTINLGGPVLKSKIKIYLVAFLDHSIQVNEIDTNTPMHEEFGINVYISDYSDTDYTTDIDFNVSGGTSGGAVVAPVVVINGKVLTVSTFFAPVNKGI